MTITSSNWNRNFQYSQAGESIFEFRYNSSYWKAEANFKNQEIQLIPPTWFSGKKEIIKDGEKVGWIKRIWTGGLNIHVKDEMGRLRSFRLKQSGFSFKEFVLRSLDTDKKILTLKRTSKWYNYNYQFEVKKHLTMIPGIDLDELVIYALHGANLNYQGSM